MKYIMKIFLLTLIISSCNSKHKNCKPDVKAYYFHNNSTIREFTKGDSIAENIMKNPAQYDGGLEAAGFKFIFKGENTVFEYYHDYEQCYSESFIETFLFQVPSYLDDFKVTGENLKYLHCTYDCTGPSIGCFDWTFKKGMINGKKTNDTTWLVKVDVTGYCGDTINKSDDSVNIKYFANFIKHDKHCDRYIQTKK